MINEKTLLLLDFDGTITTKDSFPLFFKHAFSYLHFLFGFALFSPLYILYKINLLSGEQFKSSILSFYLKGESKTVLEKLGKSFIIEITNKKIIKSDFISKIHHYKTLGATIAVVSASPDIWVDAFCQNYGINSICTNLEYNNQCFTGKLSSKNCNGIEKKIRIESIYDLKKFDFIIAFGNSNGDKAMFDLAHEAHLI